MASGSAGRANSGSKGFEFGSDDILCSYEDYGTQDSSNGTHSEPVIATTSSKDFHKSRMARSSGYPPNAYNQPEDSFSQDVMSAVEKSMKKYADNLMRFLEGISSRLSQLELYCYNLDKSIGEMRADLVRDHGEADTKLKALDKHLQEVHRSVQILRDKQELAETQKELAKLQMTQKDSSSSSHSQSTEDRASPPTSDAKRTDSAPEMHNQQLALALPHQIAPQQPAAPPPAPSQTLQNQQPSYYVSNQLPNPAAPTQLPNPAAANQHPQSQYLAPESQYRTPQLQDTSRVAPQPTQSQVNQTTPVQSFQQYQQWPQQVPPPQQQPVQPQMKPPSTMVYSPYPPNQAANTPTEAVPNSMPMQMSYTGVPQPGSSRADAVPYGYGGAGRTVQQQPQAPPPPQQLKGTFGGQQGEAYMTGGPHSALPPGSSYMMYDSEGSRSHIPQPSHYPQAGYPPSNVPLPNATPPTGSHLMLRNPSSSQFTRGHPYGELIDKLVSMGFRGDHVASVIQRMEDSGQPVDFNAVLDRLNVSNSGPPQSGW